MKAKGLELPKITLIDPMYHSVLERRRVIHYPNSRRRGRYAWSVLLFLYDQADRTTTWPMKILYRRGYKKIARALARGARQLEQRELIMRLTYEEDRRTKLLRLQVPGEMLVAMVLPPK